MNNKIKNLIFVLVLAGLLAASASVTLTWAAEMAVQPSAYSAVPVTPPNKTGLALPLQQTDNLTINDIIGATYDPATGELIVIGQVLDNPDLPSMDYDDVKENLVVALRALHSAPESPAVTIDPIPGNPNASYHRVEFFGNITNTHYGYVFFESDRLLKTYSQGRDNLNSNNPFSSTVPGYNSFFDRWVDSQDTAYTSLIRWWLTSSLHLRVDAVNSQTILFSNTQVILNWELMAGTSTPKMTTAANAFQAHFNANYNQFAAEQHNRFENNALAELPQLYKLYGIAYWSSVEDKVPLSVHGINGGWLDHYPLINTPTPLTTPVVSRTRSFTEGMIIHTVIVTGGAATTPPQSKVADLYATQSGLDALNDKPDLQIRSWHCCLGGDSSPFGDGTATCRPAVAMAFNLSDNLTQDHSFEGGPDSALWVQNPGGDWDLIVEDIGHRGNYGVYLGGLDDVDEHIYQQITMPISATHPRLSYYWAMFSNETASLPATPRAAGESDLPPFVTVNLPQAVLPLHLKRTSNPVERAGDKDISIATAYDFLYGQILDTNDNVLQTLQVISNEDIRNQWQLSSFSLDGYQGQTIRVRFRATNDFSNPTIFYIDDVSLDVDPIVKVELPDTKYILTGQVIHSGAALANVRLTTSHGLSTTTNASGRYTFTNLLADTYTLTPNLAGYVFSPANRTVSVPPNQGNINFAGTKILKNIYLPILIK